MAHPYRLIFDPPTKTKLLENGTGKMILGYNQRKPNTKLLPPKFRKISSDALIYTGHLDTNGAVGTKFIHNIPSFCLVVCVDHKPEFISYMYKSSLLSFSHEQKHIVNCLEVSHPNEILPHWYKIAIPLRTVVSCGISKDMVLTLNLVDFSSLQFAGISRASNIPVFIKKYSLGNPVINNLFYTKVLTWYEMPAKSIQQLSLKESQNILEKMFNNMLRIGEIMISGLLDVNLISILDDCKKYSPKEIGAMLGPLEKGLINLHTSLSMESIESSFIAIQSYSHSLITNFKHHMSEKKIGKAFGKESFTKTCGWYSLSMRVLEVVTQIVEGVIPPKRSMFFMLDSDCGQQQNRIILSLLAICIDPSLRTFSGFKKCISTYWNQSKSFVEKTPYCFLLFLDSVFQLSCQFPTAFEFSSNFLAAVFVNFHCTLCTYEYCAQKAPQNVLTLDIFDPKNWPPSQTAYEWKDFVNNHYGRSHSTGQLRSLYSRSMPLRMKKRGLPTTQSKFAYRGQYYSSESGIPLDRAILHPISMASVYTPWDSLYFRHVPGYCRDLLKQTIRGDPSIMREKKPPKSLGKNLNKFASMTNLNSYADADTISVATMNLQMDEFHDENLSGLLFNDPVVDSYRVPLPPRPEFKFPVTTTANEASNVSTDLRRPPAPPPRLPRVTLSKERLVKPPVTPPRRGPPNIDSLKTAKVNHQVSNYFRP